MTHKLTKREHEILDCLMDGLSYKETAQKLCIEMCTLKAHISNIFRKKLVNNIQQLLVVAFKKKYEALNLQEEFKRIQKQIYRQMAEEIQKKINEVQNDR